LNALKLAKRNLEPFLNELREFGNLQAPLRKGKNSFVFAEIVDFRQIAFDFRRTLLPLKKYLLPPVESLLSFSPEGYETVLEASDKKILIGPHPCDIHAVRILDLVFSSEYPDPYYFLRRKNLIIIGFDCVPDDKCFCRSMGTDSVEEGFDLFFSDIENAYLVAVGSSAGDDMIRASEKLLETAGKGDIEAYLSRRNRRREQFSLSLDISDLPYIMELEEQSHVWEELGSLCLCCGSCSVVCPTCTCFNVYDEPALHEKQGTRYRQWDSCLFRDYAMVAGGHNFREKRADRVKNRYYHKQKGFVQRYGRPSCVGCGRCIEACPARIHMVEVFKRIRGESRGG
jgi:sulfhydrogenase subunit beta (sulfur reductase)